MSSEDTSLKTIDAFNRHDAAGFAALYTVGAVVYDPQYPEPLKGQEAIRKDVEAFFKAFPDARISIITTISGEDKDIAASELELTGTHQGPIVTPAGTVPATNRRVSMRVGRFVRVDPQGRIVEESRYYDLAGMMQQLGLTP